jgi:hypothetical protein
MAFSVFISYSTKDLSRARQIKRILEGTRSEVFLAEYSLPPGSELGQGILGAIKECDLFLLLWSSNAKSSEWVPQEIGVARAHKRPIIPVMLHKGIELPGFLKGLKYLPLYKDPNRALVWLQRNVFQQAQKKQQRDGLVWLGIGGVVLWLLSQGDGDVNGRTHR